MIAVIKPSLISGTVSATPSKSAMQRACALALLNNGTTTIKNPGESNDDLAALDIITKCGALIKSESGLLIINSNGKIDPDKSIHFGESGLALRMFAPILSLSNKKINLTGQGSLINRPVHQFNSFFPELGVQITSNKGFLPITLQGPLKPKDIIVSGSESSQYITGLLFALAKAAETNITLSVDELKSRPYVQLSIQMLRHFGYNVSSDDLIRFQINPMVQKERNIIYETEGDWSAAAFLLIAAVTSGDVEIRGLEIESMQGDRIIVEILRSCGAEISMSGGSVRVRKARKLLPFEFDATDYPDLFPPLVVLAASCIGVSNIKGVSRLLNKESDRAASLQDVFSRMGIEIRLEGDVMLVTGGQIKGAQLNGHHDHRIVMASAIAALSAEGEMVIKGADAIEKSYPLFFTHLRMLGADVSLTS